MKNVGIFDQISFPNNIFFGSTGAPATVSFEITYTKVEDSRRHVRATSTDPLSPFNWAGEMSNATYSGTFSVAYTDGKFSAQGSFGSTQIFAEMGTERNGSFVRNEDRDEGQNAAGGPFAGVQRSAIATPQANSPKFRGKIPVEYLVH